MKQGEYAIRLGAAAIIVGLLSACGVMRGTPIPTPTPATLTASADQIAQAMQDDEFFSTYGHAILHVTGFAKRVTQDNGKTVIELGTNIRTTVHCYVDDPTASAPEARASITVESTEGVREFNAVGLLHCKVIGP